MKSNKIIVGIAGVLVFLSIALTFIWLLPSKNSSDTKALALDEAIAKIRNKEVSEAVIKQDSLVLTNKNKEEFYTKFDASDETRTTILNEIDKVNKEKPNSIKTTQEQSSSGWNWIVLYGSLPFYLMWAATLAVIVYAVRSLSRNKG
jgi:ATP-dependent Zn protease